MASATAISQVLVFWVGGRDVIAGRLSVGELIAINLFVANLAWPTLAIGWMLSMWQRGIASWSRIQDMLRAAPSITMPKSPSRLGTQAATQTTVTANAKTPIFSLNTVSTSPDTKIDILKDLTLSINNDDFTAFVGRTGSGKTMLIDVLTRLVPVSRGIYAYRGQHTDQLDPAAIRRDIAYAPQDSFLFSISIRDNILLGRYGITEEEKNDPFDIDKVIHDAGLTADISQFEKGLDTIVGERGVTLSGGQKQRLSLARALAADRPILILDDTLSALDAKTETEVLANLRNSPSISTLIVVSHRMSAVRDADIIHVLDEGRIVQSGDFNTLATMPGLFQTLYLSHATTDSPSPSARELSLKGES